MPFQIAGLSPTPFRSLFEMDELTLRTHRARRVFADAPHAFPCRISLRDAEPGDELILTHFVHQPTDSPFHASHAIYVRREAEKARLAIGEVPDQLRRRMLSLRAFDAEGMMRAADLVDGREVEALIEAQLADPEVANIHAHFAKHGCFAARIARVS